VGGGSYDRRTAIHSAKEVKMRRVGKQRDGYNSCRQEKCKKGGVTVY